MRPYVPPGMKKKGEGEGICAVYNSKAYGEEHQNPDDTQIAFLYLHPSQAQRG